MVIYKIKFKRAKESEWETGINVESEYEPGCILSKTGEVLLEVFDWKPMTNYFCIDLTPILKD